MGGEASRRARIRVVVADDHPLYRDGVVRAVKNRPELELVGVAVDGDEALAEIRRLEPDVALLDVRMPGLEGPQIVTAIQRDGLPTKAILLSAQTESATVFDAVSGGAQGYLSKDAGGKAICEAVSSVARGETVLAPELQGGLVSEVQRRSASEAPALTAREREALRLIAAGRSAPQIGAELHLSPATVKTHLHTLYEKLGVSDRAAAVAEAMRRGLLE